MRAFTIALILAALHATGCPGPKDVTPVAPANGVVEGPPAPRPNVLLVVIDCLRADHVGAYGYDKDTTPVLDRLAEDSLLFERAYAPASWTMPSHAAFFTGRVGTTSLLPEEQGLAIEPWTPTLAGVLGATGYRTGYFGDAPVMRVWPSMARGFDHAILSLRDELPAHHESPLVRGETLPRLPSAPQSLDGGDDPVIDGGWPGAAFAEAGQQARDSSFARTIPAFLDWVDQDDDAPFFAYLHGNDVHFPYECEGAAAFAEGELVPLSGEDIMDEISAIQGAKHAAGLQVTETKKRVDDVLDADERATLIAQFDACVRYSDGWLGELLTGLEGLSQLEDTLLIVTADHGESLGERNMYGHGALLNSVSLGEEILRVPLVVSYPRQGTKGRREGPVSLVDLFPTILETAGVPPFESEGHSLWNAPDSSEERRIVARGSREAGESARGRTSIGTPDHFAVIQGGMKVTTIYGETKTMKLGPRFQEWPVTGPSADATAHSLLEEIWIPQTTQPMNPAPPEEAASVAPPLNLVVIDIPGLRRDGVIDDSVVPRLTSLASESVVFETAAAASYWTLPSVTSLFTGQHPGSHGLMTRQGVLPFNLWTIAEVLQAHGYRTIAWTGGLDTSAGWGIDQGFELYLNAPPEQLRTLAEVTPEVTDWIWNNGDKPFFVYLSGYDLHAPWHPPDLPNEPAVGEIDCSSLDARWLASWRAEEGEDRVVLPDGTEIEVEQLTALVSSCYDDCLRSLDTAVGRVVTSLEQSGVLDRTVLVVTAPHGESLGEQGHFARYHARELGAEVSRVPLMIRMPGAVSRRVDTWVGTTDVMPTALELLGIDPPAGCEGRSVASAFSLDADASPPVTRGALSVRDRNAIAFHCEEGLLQVDLPGPVRLYTLSGEPNDDPAARWAAMQRLDRFARERDLRVRPAEGVQRRLDGALRDLLERYGYWNLVGEGPAAP